MRSLEFADLDTLNASPSHSPFLLKEIETAMDANGLSLRHLRRWCAVPLGSYFGHVQVAFGTNYILRIDGFTASTNQW